MLESAALASSSLGWESGARIRHLAMALIWGTTATFWGYQSLGECDGSNGSLSWRNTNCIWFLGLTDHPEATLEPTLTTAHLGQKTFTTW